MSDRSRSQGVELREIFLIGRQAANSVLVKHASFLSNVPNQAHYQTPSGEKRYFPSPEFFQFLVEHLVIPIVSSITASFVTERFIKAKTAKVGTLPSEEIRQLESALEQDKPRVTREMVRQNVAALLGSSPAATTRSGDLEAVCRQVLVEHGWPAKIAQKDVEAVIVRIAEDVHARLEKH
jgi:hypothetical protein